MIPSVGAVAAWGLGQLARGRPEMRPAPGLAGWFTDSRNAVLLVLAGALVIGGGRKLILALKARKMLDALNGPEPGPESFVEATRHGRAAAMDLFRILGSSAASATRNSAGRALSVLWKADELIAEEEKAIVSRGYVASWKARRRYPRALSAPIPIEVAFGVPFLEDEGEGVGPKDLEWSHRIVGTERASMESYSAWQPGAPSASFSIEPRDYPGNGPHRLILQARVRTTTSTTAWGAEMADGEVGAKKTGATSRLNASWELELPHIPFSFEFDPNLTMDSLFTLPDAARGAELSGRIRLVEAADAANPRFAILNGEWAIRDLANLEVRMPLPCDLAHVVRLEIEGCPDLVAAGAAVVSIHGGSKDREGPVIIPLVLEPNLPPGAIEATGDRRARAILSPDANLGWANPDIRSIWPEEIVTDWQPIRVVRI